MQPIPQECVELSLPIETDDIDTSIVKKGMTRVEFVTTILANGRSFTIWSWNNFDIDLNNTVDWKQCYNSLSSVKNSNHKPNSFKLDTIYYKTHSQLNMRTIINQWNQTFNNVNNCCKLLTMLFLSWIQSQVFVLLHYRSLQNKI